VKRGRSIKEEIRLLSELLLFLTLAAGVLQTDLQFFHTHSWLVPVDQVHIEFLRISWCCDLSLGLEGHKKTRSHREHGIAKRLALLLRVDSQKDHSTYGLRQSSSIRTLGWSQWTRCTLSSFVSVGAAIFHSASKATKKLAVTGNTASPNDWLLSLQSGHVQRSISSDRLRQALIAHCIEERSIHVVGDPESVQQHR